MVEVMERRRSSTRLLMGDMKTSFSLQLKEK